MKKYDMKNNLTAPWIDSQFYRVNGIPMVYERLEGGILSRDVIMDYEGKAWTVAELEQQGYTVEEPRLFRDFSGDYLKARSVAEKRSQRLAA